MFGVVIMCLLGTGSAFSTTEKKAWDYILDYSNVSRTLWSVVTHKRWDFEVTLTNETAAELTKAHEDYDNYQIETYPKAKSFPWQTFSDSLRRQFQIRLHQDEAALPLEKRNRRQDVINEMTKVYNTAQIKKYRSDDVNDTLYINDLQEIFATELMDTCQLAYYWDGWHTTVGRGVKSGFEEFVQLENLVATLNNVTDAAAYWQDSYETVDFEEVLANLMDEITPFFKELHAYIRKRLWIAHGYDSCIVNPKGPIPVHILGNIWGLDGVNIYNITAPFPDRPELDVTSLLQAQNYTVVKMARAAEQFYLSLNMSAMTDTFWEKSIFEKPTTGDFDCSNVAYTFFDGEDFRIRMCASVTQEYYRAIHYAMGHIENYMTWSKIPWLFQDAPNPGFNEATGDLMNLYTLCPTHLKNVGLLPSDFVVDKEQGINALYQQALAIVFFLPYAYTLDLWRWRVFQGKITPDHYNSEYWKLRLQYQGVVPPVCRSEEDFDPGAKYHIPANYQYIAYFVSGVLQFQFHKALCIAAGQYDPANSTSNPLHLCDIYNSTTAGNKLESMMVLGRSRPWPDALEIITGQRQMDTGPLLEFFDPLYQWLKNENSKNKEQIGWETCKNRYCEERKSTCNDLEKCSYNTKT